MKQEIIKSYCLSALARYWLTCENEISTLPVNANLPSDVQIPTKLEFIQLPEWAKHIGVNGQILVPSEVVLSGSSWENINWWYVIYWYLNCLAERKYEEMNGPLHSYSFRLKGWDSRMWDHAWVNRIAIFLSLWAKEKDQPSGQSITSSAVMPEIYITHDLDAIKKTLAIRLKQTAFHLFNSVRALFSGDFFHFSKKFKKALRFFFGVEDYRNFKKLELNKSGTCITKQIINVYGGNVGKEQTIKQKLFDPSYDIRDPELIFQLEGMSKKGVEIGLHQSFDAWEEKELVLSEADKVRNAMGFSITTCRQHWLRFSFSDTWLAQSQSGFMEDTTLGFNDRPGFRNGAALAFKPIGMDGTTLPITSVPMVLMDSHLYDYEQFDDEQRNQAIDRWVTEIEEVGGQASIIWHPHTLGEDYGWHSGFIKLINRLRVNSEKC